MKVDFERSVKSIVYMEQSTDGITDHEPLLRKHLLPDGHKMTVWSACYLEIIVLHDGHNMTVWPPCYLEIILLPDGHNMTVWPAC